jgi:hypothetical protein
MRRFLAGVATALLLAVPAAGAFASGPGSDEEPAPVPEAEPICIALTLRGLGECVAMCQNEPRTHVLMPVVGMGLVRVPCAVLMGWPGKHT